MPRHRNEPLEDSVSEMIREFQANRGMDVESEDDFFETLPKRVYPNRRIPRDQVVVAFRRAVTERWRSEHEVDRLEETFQEALDYEIKAALGETRLQRLGGINNVVQRTTRRIRGAGKEDAPKLRGFEDAEGTERNN